MGQCGEEGLQDILEIYFATPSDFYIGLCSDLSIAKDAAYTDLTEVTGSGYDLIALSTITIATLGVDNRKATGDEVTFNASGTWTSAYYWFMITPAVASGAYTLVCWDSVKDSPVELESGESLAIIPIFNATG